jgi:hypothetical protein
MNIRAFCRGLVETVVGDPRRVAARRVGCFQQGARIEWLEQRIAPANLTATVANHTLTIVGTADANDLTIAGVTGHSTDLLLSSTTDSINGNNAPVNVAGVTSISINQDRRQCDH